MPQDAHFPGPLSPRHVAPCPPTQKEALTEFRADGWEARVTQPTVKGYPAASGLGRRPLETSLHAGGLQGCG